MDKEFSIYLGEKNDTLAIAKLYKHALNALKEEVNEKRINLERFNLIIPYTQGNLWGIDACYNFKTKNEIKLEKTNIESTTLNKVSSPTDSIETLGEISDGHISMVNLRLEQGANQGDDIALVEYLIEYMKTMKPAHVLDCIFKDFCDDDGLRHPFFTLYITK